MKPFYLLNSWNIIQFYQNVFLSGYLKNGKMILWFYHLFLSKLYISEWNIKWGFQPGAKLSDPLWIHWFENFSALILEGKKCNISLWTKFGNSDHSACSPVGRWCTVHTVRKNSRQTTKHFRQKIAPCIINVFSIMEFLLSA